MRNGRRKFPATVFIWTSIERYQNQAVEYRVSNKEDGEGDRISEEGRQYTILRQQLFRLPENPAYSSSGNRVS